MNAKTAFAVPVLLVASALLAGCASTGSASNEAPAEPAFRLVDSFRPQGQAGLDRLEQNTMQRTCSEYEGRMPPTELVAQITSEALAAVRFPTDGEWFGDWKAGEHVAKTGTGLQSSDDPAVPNGGNCYACHQMAAEEIAYGTLGPPLNLYGKLRGTSEPMLKYTWTRLWNSHAYNVCSHMPRFGEAGILTEQQLKDVMAYLFDPASPVNLAAEGSP